MTIQANITAYKGKLVCELLAKKSIDNVVTTSFDTSSFGQIVHDTANHLGVSKEAFDLLKTVNSCYGLGDIDWFSTRDGKFSFGWMGSPCRIVHIDRCEASHNFCLGAFIEIENNVPEGAKRAIDAQELDTDSPSP